MIGSGLITEVIDPIDLCDSSIAEFHSYWQSRHNALGGIPSLQNLDLMDIYRLAPSVVILDVIKDESPSLQFKWRFVGTKLREVFFAVELTGNFVHSHGDNKWAEKVQACYESIVATCNPHMWRCRERIFSNAREPVPYTRLLLPVTGNADTVEHIIGIYVQDQP